jgi:transcriptional regulator NrdR family protein
MNCKDCDSKKTSVVWTQKQPGGVRRLRKCHKCGFRAYTGEVWLAQLPPPESKAIYTENEAAAIKKKVVSTRRKNEDRRQDEKTK